jgi:RING-type zinc-finger
MSTLFETTDDDVPPVFSVFDEALRCKICGEYFRSAVTIANTKCGHSFCSECIRNTFRQQLSTTNRQRRCPQCNYEVQSESRELVKNFSLQEAVQAYKISLPLIQQAMLRASPKELPADGEADENQKHSIEVCAARVSAGSDSDRMEEGVTTKKPVANYTGKKKRQLHDMVRDDCTFGELLTT